MAKHVALLVGWTEYGDDRLTAPHDDAALAALAEALRQPQHGRFDSVHLLLEQTAVDAQLTIAAFLEQPHDPDDLLLLHLSGHCLFVGEEIVLAASDTFSEPYLDATVIQAEFIRRRLRQCPARVLLVLDVVYSRADAAPEPEAEKLLERAFAAPEYPLLFASRPADQPHPSTSLTQALTDGVKNQAADSDGNGRLTLREWFSHAAQQTPAARQRSAAEQMEWVITAVSPALLNPPIPSAPAASAPPPTQAKYSPLLALGLLALLLLLFGGLYTLSNRPAASATDPTSAGQLALVGETATATSPATPQPSPTATLQATPQASPTSPQPPATRDQTTPQATLTQPATAAATATPMPTSTPTPTPTPTATPTTTATPAPIPMEIVAEAAFLRTGPGINYRIISYPVRGTGVTAVARNSDATWYNVILPDGQTGWIYTDVVRPDDAAAAAGLPLAATIPNPANEFYDFARQDSGQTLIAQVYHVYIGTAGQEAFLRARLLPETDQVQPNYLNGTRLGFGLFLVEFARSGATPYRSSQVEFCMVDSAGNPFFCQTFPAVKEW